MSATLAAEVPPLPPRPLTVADINSNPAQFYRSSDASWQKRTSGSQSARAAATQPPLPNHMQMSPRRFQTERERLEQWDRSFEASVLRASRVPYSDPLAYPFRPREKAGELGGPMRYRFHAERARVNEAITQRDVGGRAFPYEAKGPQGAVLFRRDEPNRWRAGTFTARLPPRYQFSTPERMYEPYMERKEGEASFRPTHPPRGATVVSHPRPFSTFVPIDRVLPLSDPSSPRAPHPPVRPLPGAHVLSAGLGSTGVFAPQVGVVPSLDLRGLNGHGSTSAADADAGPQPYPRTYWKAAITLAHQPAPTSTHAPAARGDAETAAQLVRTYVRHLNF